ncbi:MAG: 5-(carboxyamino)imidazole ribonucleotide synthase [Candidatus Eremiobacteraeota bacterium]|nr:5-(carboxyamino)imidazole ribonucleotide synthase [Candidatus Eremiobacteraeota bacterium]
MQVIGIIGGGQLGRMMALDAKRMGYDVIVLDPVEHSPCGQVADEQIVASYDDLAAIEELGRRSDIVTYEFENIAIASVERLEQRGFNVTPSSDVLRVTQDRLVEKQFVRDLGIGTADFGSESIGYPAIAKTTRGGYDGKGQWRVTDDASAQRARDEANGAALIWERLIPFERELSVVATRGRDGSVVSYPPGENLHDAGILAMTIAPARVSDDVAHRAAEIARKIGEGLGIVGTYAVELFALADGTLLVNEIAPRPHNSGHYTIDASASSQYEQHIRAICGLPLSTQKLYSGAIMMNILGAGTGNLLTGSYELLADPSIVLHFYGKRHAVARRKMGHFTMLTDGVPGEKEIARAHEAHARLRWTDAAD